MTWSRWGPGPGAQGRVAFVWEGPAERERERESNEGDKVPRAK